MKAAALLALILSSVGLAAWVQDTVLDPQWESRPTFAEYAKAYPKAGQGIDTLPLVVLRCRAAIDGAMTDCNVVSQTPAGRGFGAAALELAPLYRTRGLQEGTPVEFRVDFGASLLPPAIEQPQWAQVPSAEEMTAKAPARGEARRAARVTLRCWSNAEGALQRCSVRSETPRDSGFGEAALALAPLYKLKTPQDDNIPLNGRRVTFNVDFAAAG